MSAILLLLLFLFFLRRRILVRYQKEEEEKKEPNFRRRRRIGLLPFLLFLSPFFTVHKNCTWLLFSRDPSLLLPFSLAGASQHNNCHVTVQKQGFYFPCFEHAFLREKPLLLPIHSAKANQSHRNIKWRAHAASPYYYYFVTLRGQLLQWYWCDLGFGIGL